MTSPLNKDDKVQLPDGQVGFVNRSDRLYTEVRLPEDCLWVGPTKDVRKLTLASLQHIQT